MPERAEEKQESRQKDAEDLASGAKTREQLWAENSFLPPSAAKAPIDFSKIGSVRNIKTSRCKR